MIVTKIELDNRRNNNVANVINVISSKPIDSLTISKLTDILSNTECPNEAMFGAINGFKSFNGKDTITME